MAAALVMVDRKEKTRANLWHLSARAAACPAREFKGPRHAQARRHCQNRSQGEGQETALSCLVRTRDGFLLSPLLGQFLPILHHCYFLHAHTTQTDTQASVRATRRLRRGSAGLRRAAVEQTGCRCSDVSCSVNMPPQVRLPASPSAATSRNTTPRR